MSISRLVVWYRILPSGMPRKVKGRVAWALLQLAAAGLRGCTSQSTPAPHWAAYVHRLREQGLRVVTIEEKHDGPFAVRHARYVLGGRVAVGSTVAEVVGNGSYHASAAPKTDGSYPAPAPSAATGAQNERD
ncbi:winged helix domain-containing protein [Devosia sp. CN2-171]|uniref:winged helix domain-containing protein n=1 Tax=Devosia sp. CN2-171 TaxID=3400909 RepID=UPI003BF86B64